MSSCSVPGQVRRVFKDAGRVCPVDYRLASDAFAGDPEVACDVLYVVGGLYGNPFALDAVDCLVAAEQGDVRVVLNGDMHWFDKTAENFAALERRASRYLPLVGNVAAGSPILAEENITDTISLPTDIVGDAPSFLLSVRGESMIEAGINDGDYVVVKEQPVANNGDIVVAIIDDGATVKRFYKESDHIRLQPENSTMEPIITTDCSIAGKVVAVFRRL